MTRRTQLQTSVLFDARWMTIRSLSFLFLILHKAFLELKLSRSFQHEADIRHRELPSRKVNVDEALTSENTIVK